MIPRHNRILAVIVAVLLMMSVIAQKGRTAGAQTATEPAVPTNRGRPAPQLPMVGDPNELVGVTLILKAPSAAEATRTTQRDRLPGAVASATGQRAQADAKAQQDRVAADIQGKAPGSHRGNGSAILVNRITMAVPRKDLGRLRDTEGVAAVYPEHLYYSAMDHIYDQVGAPRAARLVEGMPNAGAGMKIAILDTGVDHTSPFLNATPNGPAQPGFTRTPPAGFPKTTSGNEKLVSNKVIVSKDFCDPRINTSSTAPCHPSAQDNVSGHGTHVAGIAAGNYGAVTTVPGSTTPTGTMTGIAPAAWIGNYQVLDRGGLPGEYKGPSGSSSEIAAGIEAAVLDGMDILNVSLGGGGDRNDVAALMVEKAVQAGATVVIAAGNEGPGTVQIGSPGAAPSAITVAASTSTRSNPGYVAEFSNRGPNRDDTFKPDVAAPGTFVLSSASTQVPNPSTTGYSIHSGTSMATPVVSGGAAILKAQHPTWTPGVIKSVLQNTGTPLKSGTRRAGTWEVGGGQINLPAANSAALAASPSALAFGRHNQATEPVTTTTTKVTITDLVNTARRYAITVEPDPGTPNPGLSVATTSVAVDAGGTATLDVSLRPSASVAEGTSTFFSGKVRLTAADTPDITIPYMFRQVNVPVRPYQVLLVDDNGLERAGANWDLPSSSPLQNPSSRLFNEIRATNRQALYWNRLYLGEPELADLEAAGLVVWSHLATRKEFNVNSNLFTFSETNVAMLDTFLGRGGRINIIGELTAEMAYFSYLGENGVSDNKDLFLQFFRDRLGIDVRKGIEAQPPCTTNNRVTGQHDEVTNTNWFGSLGPISLTNPLLARDNLWPTNNGRTSYKAADGVGVGVITNTPLVMTPDGVTPASTSRVATESFSAYGATGASGAQIRDRVLDWLEDTVVVQPSAESTDLVVTLTGGGSSSAGAEMAYYRIDWGDGSGIQNAGPEPVGHRYGGPGSYRVRVEATDAAGHRGVGETVARVPGPLDPVVGTTLAVGSTLRAGQTITSPNGTFHLTMQPDGNLVLYHGATAVWHTWTFGRPGARATLQSDGNLVVYDPDGSALWHASTYGSGVDKLVLQDDSNLVLYTPGNGPGWSRVTGQTGRSGFLLRPGQLLNPGSFITSPSGVYRLTMQQDGNLVFYEGERALWHTWSWTSPDAYATVRADGNFVVVRDGSVLWQSNTAGTTPHSLDAQNDSNLVLYSTAGPLWWRWK